jgi:hypothetical protein
MGKGFINLEYPKVLEFSQVFGYSIEDSRDVLTYIVEHDILTTESFADNEDFVEDDELQAAYESGYEDAIREAGDSLPSRYDAGTYRRPKKDK